MAARNHARSTATHVAGYPDGAAEAGVLQAFMIDLERHGLVQVAQPHLKDRVRGSDGLAPASRPADIENAVRKLIAALKEAS